MVIVGKELYYLYRVIMRVKYLHNSIEHNTRAAEKIVPFLLNHFNFSNVVDVGCGTGTWLKVFADYGIDILGIEGFHLDKNKLVVPESKILLHDLEKPLRIEKQFDLAISLEVAEHLGKDSAPQFVESITKLSNVILFSAALPFQGGQNHVNEKWPSYWIDLFKKFDFFPLDIVRPAFWNDEGIEYWYKQNSFLFVSREFIKNFSGMPSFNCLNIVHPDLYFKKAFYLNDLINGRRGLLSSIKIFIKAVTNLFGYYKNDKNTSIES